MSGLSIEKLSHIALNVSDMEKSAAFYREVLGFEQLYTRDLGRIGYSSGFLTPSGVMVELLQFLDEDGVPKKVDASVDTVRLAFSVTDFDEAKAKLGALGFSVENAMEFEGIHMVFINDPDGRAVEITQFPDGRLSAAQMHAD